MPAREITTMAAPADVLVVPYPIQGHINPMLQFAKILASKGPATTLVTTHFILNSLPAACLASARPVAFVPISDGHDRGGPASCTDPEDYNAALIDAGSRTLSQLIQDRILRRRPFSCVVYDTFAPWVADVARRHGLTPVAFSTQSCAVSAIYHYVRRGLVEAPAEAGGRVAPPGMPEMERWEFPSFALSEGQSAYPAIAEYALNQFDMGKDDWVLFNSFDDLETKVMQCCKGEWRALTVGPCVPLTSADYGMSLFPSEDDVCLRWLNALPQRSAVYVSFGSIASLGAAQTLELARALEACGAPFLWVVRAAEEGTLPADFSTDPTPGRLIVRWAPQLAVLGHAAVGCFVTHCGWNSTLEAVTRGVPMVPLALWTDQPTNAKLVEEAWGVGVRPRRGEGEGALVVGRPEIERRVREVMDEGRRREEIRANARRWMEKAREAVGPGGSTDRNLDEFVGFVQAKAKEVYASIKKSYFAGGEGQLLIDNGGFGNNEEYDN